MPREKLTKEAARILLRAYRNRPKGQTADQFGKLHGLKRSALYRRLKLGKEAQ